MASYEATVLSGTGQARRRQLSAFYLPVSLIRTNPLAAAWATAALLWFAAILYMGALTQSQPFFDDDHSWLARSSEAGWGDLASDILRPVPEAWGFQDRPVQELCFKVLSSFTDESPAAFHSFKAVVYACAVAATFGIALLVGGTVSTAGAAALIFGVSSPVFTSVLWIADFELLAQLLMLAAFGFFLYGEKHRLFESNLVRFRILQISFVVLSLLAHRTKGSAKLIPAIVLVYLLTCRRDALRRWLAPLAAVTVTIVPIFQVMEQPTAPFLPFAADQSQGWMWQPASWEPLKLLLFGNFHPVLGTTNGDVATGLAAVLAPALFWLSAAAALVYLAWGGASQVSRTKIRFCTIWLSIVVVSFSAFPVLPPMFMSRYLAGALIPAAILSAFLVAAAAESVRKMSGGRFYRGAAVAAILVHAWLNFGHTRAIRDSLGQLIVANDRARAALTRDIQNADILLVGMSYGYRRTPEDDNRYLEDAADVDLARPVYAVVQAEGDILSPNYDNALQNLQPALQRLPLEGGAYRVGLRKAGAFHGLTDSFYDRWIYGGDRSYMALLFEVKPESIPREALPGTKGNS